MRPRNRNCSISNQSLFVFSVLTTLSEVCFDPDDTYGNQQELHEKVPHCDSKGAGMFDHVRRSLRYDNG